MKHEGDQRGRVGSSGMHPSCAMLVGVFSIGILACGAPLPSSQTEVLDQATTFEILRIDPDADPSTTGGADSFAGHKVLAKSAVTDPAARRRIREIVDSGLKAGGTQAKCFNPRHAIHAVSKQRTVDVIICFECSTAEIAEGSEVETRAFGDVSSDLEAEFVKAGLPLSHAP